jgi:hypothetical protein
MLMALTDREIAIAKGMLARGDRQHDIAAYFGENGGRIGEISTGMRGAGIHAALGEISTGMRAQASTPRAPRNCRRRVRTWPGARR